MTALQELSLSGKVELQASETVQNLKQLILQHSLAKVVLPDKLVTSIAEGRQLPCKWLPAPTYAIRPIKFL